MPSENVEFLPRSQLLTFEEIERVVDVALRLGVNKIRLTGGEPLVRNGLPDLIRRLSRKQELTDLSMTTNGILLGKYSRDLFDSGLHRLNISLDTLREEVFQKISRRPGLNQVLDGIAAAKSAGFKNIRINAVAIADVNEADVVPLARFCREQDLHLRFIEFMPLDADRNWRSEQVFSGKRIRQIIERELGELTPVTGGSLSQPAKDFKYADGIQQVGFIDPVSQPFCGDCNRLRMTAEGQLRNCLFGMQEWDARAVLRGGGSDSDLVELFQECVLNKKAGHGIDDPNFVRPDRAMYQIGG